VVEPEIVLSLAAPKGVLIKRLKEKGGKKVADEGVLRAFEASKKDVDPLVEYYTKRHKLQTIPCDDTSEGAPNLLKI
jgi:adenylate kinase family enzyme